MKEDDLEKFIQENRAAFDERMPSLKVWASIDKQLAQKPTQQRVSIFSIVRKVAAVLAIMTMGGLLAIYFLNTQNGEEKDIAQLHPDFEEIESYYQSAINQKVAQLTSLEYDPSIQEDLEQLDEFLEELKIALHESPKGKEEEIINAMINNYQTRMKILERVLDQIETKGQEKKSTKEETTTI